MSHDLEEKFVSDDGVSTVEDPATPEGGAIKKKKADVAKKVDPKAERVAPAPVAEEAVEDKEAVRRGTTLFALPTHAGDGAKLIWGTVDAIWSALGDTSEDVNWYTKRATLGTVYSATVLYWLGDNEPDNAATWEFLDRRIDNVMQIEKLKAQVKDSPTLSKLMAGPNWLLGQIKAPQKMPEVNLPGSWTTPRC